MSCGFSTARRPGWLRFDGQFLFLLFGVGLATSFIPIQAQYLHHYFKQPKPLSLPFLTVGESRVAVLSPTPDFIAELGAEPHAIEPWYTANIPSNLTTQEALEAWLDSVTAAGQAEFASPVFTTESGHAAISTPWILIEFARDCSPQQAQEIIRRVTGSTEWEQDWSNMPGAYRVHCATGSGCTALSWANELATLSEVVYAEPDMIFTGTPNLIPNDPSFGSQWALNNTGQGGGVPDIDVDAPEAWDITIGSPEIAIVIIDVGVEDIQPDLTVVDGTDTTSQGPGPGYPVSALDNHGTTMAGPAAATINNDEGIVGVAPGCSLMSARTFIMVDDTSWTSMASWTVDSLNWAQNVGARVTNNSNAYGFTSAAVANKYASSRLAGMVHFSSSGNAGASGITYPGSLATVMSVGSVDREGIRSTFSNFGTGLNFLAPGETVRTTDRAGASGYVSGDYFSGNGTSLASPHAAGVAALLLSLNPGLTAAEVEQVLEESCFDLGTPGYDSLHGWGLINARNAVEDCNANGTPDAMDLTLGNDTDCNNNGIPDACDSNALGDCNGNGLPDSCDLDSGLSVDCNLNGIPDDCEIADGAPDVDLNGVLDVCECPPTVFVRGDINNDGNVDIADAVFALGYLFSQGDPPPIPMALDVNNDGQNNVADAIYLLNHLFGSGAPPPAPFPLPGC